MYSYAAWRTAYKSAMAKLAADPTARLDAEEAKSVINRWFTLIGSTIWGEAGYYNLSRWACDHADSHHVEPQRLLGEAEAFLVAISGERASRQWPAPEPGNTRETAITSVHATIRHLRALIEETNAPTYHDLAQRIYDDEYGEQPITEQEAKVIVAGWASEAYCPALDRWAEGHGDAELPVMLAEANQLRDDLTINRGHWPHEGEAEPSIAAAVALINYLESLAE